MTTKTNAKAQLMTSDRAGNTDPKVVDRLVRAAIEMGEAGVRATDKNLPMSKLVGDGVTYSRAWQIVAYELFSRFQPELLMPEAVKASPDQRGQAIVAMRDVQRYSWGLIGVLAGIPEGQARKEYKLNSGRLDRGQRIGHGGRFLADDPALYDAAERHTNGVIIKSQAELDRAMGKVREAAHAKDAKTFSEYVMNSTIEPKVAKKATPRKKAAKKEIAAA